MGLTRRAVGAGALDTGLALRRRDENDLVIALAGNPNVGKSTVFNALTGMHQHTGNWPGKTVATAQGYHNDGEGGLLLVDIPGTYSLLAHSAEEEVARNFICFGEPDAVAVVCDAACLVRNLNLVLQVLEITPRVVVCVNLLDEAKRRGIRVDLVALSHALGVPVIGTVARKKKSLSALPRALRAVVERTRKPLCVQYGTVLETAIARVCDAFSGKELRRLPPRWLALRLLEADPRLLAEIEAYVGAELLADPALVQALDASRTALAAAGLAGDALRDHIVCAINEKAAELGALAVRAESPDRGMERADRWLTGRRSAYPFMLLLLALVFWLTVVGANYPSQWLSYAFNMLGARLDVWFSALGMPAFLHGILLDGIYRVLAAVVSVMLPPMAIFFPLFTFLEDVGYLPRIAYNLDRPFCRCHACGKQALTMCMGFGCNAAGVVGCRIIDSPRERLLAILTNAFVPCNGRFPTLIVVLTLFFVGVGTGLVSSLLAALLLLAVILLGVVATFGATRLLAATVLRGAPSSFTLELPPYRRPQVGKILVRSVFDRTLFVLGRAAAVAAPAGAIIWLLANTAVGGESLLLHVSGALDPIGRFLGLDGVILLGFVLGFPANEIVLPIILMTYAAGGTLPVLGGTAEIGSVLLANGWTPLTAVCFILFSLMHWPCSTTVLTVHRETRSLRWTVLAVFLPTLLGVLSCACVACVARLFF
ncbi:MAG: ferrous iron transport protein B [Clostridia bacterium]|nr:ferrous iron transport protein B [Clostridia bacterium]